MSRLLLTQSGHGTCENVAAVILAAFIVALVQLAPLMSVQPAIGLFFFAAVVVLTMLAAESFDPRLIWDATNPHQASNG